MPRGLRLEFPGAYYPKREFRNHESYESLIPDDFESPHLKSAFNGDHHPLIFRVFCVFRGSSSSSLGLPRDGAWQPARAAVAPVRSGEIRVATAAPSPPRMLSITSFMSLGGQVAGIRFTFLNVEGSESTPRAERLRSGSRKFGRWSPQHIATWNSSMHSPESA